MYPVRSLDADNCGGIVAAMVTRIGGKRPIKLYLAEHREKLGVSAAQMAGRLGISRESVYRREREQHRLNPDKLAAYADALGISPERLFQHPDVPSVDAEIKNLPIETQQGAVEMVRFWISHRR